MVIPKTVKVVDSFAFSFNDNIYELEIADGVKVLESDAFTSMTNLKSVTVPDSVKEMDNCGLGMDVDDNYNSVPLKGFKMYCKKGSAAEAYAKENNLFLTIMSNLNTIAVACLLDMPVIVLAENVKPTEEMINKADDENIIIISSKYNVVDIIRKIYEI